MKIEVWSDFACPFCYIGEARLKKAVEELGKENFQIEFKSYQLNPGLPKKANQNAVEYFKGHKNMDDKQVKDFFKQISEMAATDGLVYNMDKMVMSNTLDAHRLAKWANTFNKEEALTVLLMKKYFTDGQDLANHKVLIEAAKEVGLDPIIAEAVLASNQFIDDVVGQIKQASDFGINSVPFFVIDREYGISGAQSQDYFKAALHQVMLERQNPQMVNLEGQEDASCGPDGCEIDGHDHHHHHDHDHECNCGHHHDHGHDHKHGDGHQCNCGHEHKH